MVGERLNDRYVIEHVVWSGTMSNVYRAFDEHKHRTVAVKALLHVFADNVLYRSRYEREAHILNNIQHPHIVPYIDHFQEGANFYLVMDYIGGGNLYDRIVSGNPLSINDSHHILLGISAALSTLHKRQIIHRDLKPENVILDMKGRPYLCDFGEAYTLKNHNNTNPDLNVVAGTPYYAAPETWNGQPQNAQSDIWALGIIMFEMLTGGVPFKGETVDEVKQKVQHAPLPNIKKLRSDLPDGQVDILLKLLERDTQKRYRNVQHVHQDLSRGKPAPFHLDQRWVLGGIVALLLLVIIVTIVLSTVSNNDNPSTLDHTIPPSISFFGG